MSRTPGKRDIQQVDFTAGEDVYGCDQKARRICDGQSASSNGKRFGEDTQFVPLSQSSQSLEQEDDAQAGYLVQGSQDIDDSSYSTYMLYGMYPNRTWLREY